MQENRLFKIMYHLLDKGQATAPELTEEFEVSVRTIYRDIDALSSAGIPVYAEVGRNGGIHLMNDFVLDRAALSEEKQDYNIFKLTRIIDLEVFADGFCKSPFPEFDETPGQVYNTIVLYCLKSMSYLIYDEFGKTRLPSVYTEGNPERKRRFNRVC